MGSSLYERLGGKDAIAAVVADFTARCADDERINKKFARTDIPRLKKMLVDQVCEADRWTLHIHGPGYEGNAPQHGGHCR